MIKYYKILMIFLIVVFTSCALSAAEGLTSYIEKEDSSYKYSLEKVRLFNNRQVSITDIKMTSQNWQGADWEHSVEIIYPSNCVNTGTALLIALPGEPNDNNIALAAYFASNMGTPLVMLYNVPNQPSEGKSEEALVAYSITKAHEDVNSVPVLFPMVKSVVKTMDMVEEFTRENFENGIYQFIISGTAIRGWSTWLAAASDDQRIIGTIPVGFDLVSIEKQLEKQKDYYGNYSESLTDYANIKLDELIKTTNGKKIADVIDPFAYNERLTLPKLIINSTNDQFGTVDSASIYFNELKGDSNYLFYIPNAKHDFGYFSNKPFNQSFVTQITPTLNTIKNFVTKCVGSGNISNINWIWSESADSIKCEIKIDPTLVYEVLSYEAEAPTKDFRNIRWTGKKVTNYDSNGFVFETKKPAVGVKTIYCEVKIRAQSGNYSLFTTPYMFEVGK